MIKLENRDCRDAFKRIPANSIDLIITDPPYDAQGIKNRVYKTLSQEAFRVLKPGASLISIAGNYYLPEIIEQMKKGKLQYMWMISYTHSKKHVLVPMKPIRSKFKPILWYTKGNPKINKRIADRIQALDKTGMIKKYHKWEQSFSFCQYYIKEMTKKGDTVLDPFAGSGTVGIVAEKLGRNSILFENDPVHCRNAQRKIKDYLGYSV